jgi:transposase
LCDLEAGKVVDLLPDREAATVATWLQDHPGTEIVSRDRASAYAEAARRAAPQAVQIADRWHLMRNLSDALRTVLEPHHRVLNSSQNNTAGLREQSFCKTSQSSLHLPLASIAE